MKKISLRILLLTIATLFYAIMFTFLVTVSVDILSVNSYKLTKPAEDAACLLIIAGIAVIGAIGHIKLMIEK
jgi:hypothetical protein